MSALPKSVQAQIDKANQLIAEGAHKPQPVEEVTPPPPAEVTPPAATPVAAAAPTPIPEADWAQRYRVLQGKYNAEVPRMQNQLREQGDLTKNLQQQLIATQTLLASLSQQGAPAAAATPVPLVKESEIKEFGPDLYDFIRRTAREEHSAFLPEIDKRVKPVAQAAQQAQMSAEEQAKEARRLKHHTMLALLDEQVPTWEAMNNDEGFLAWLDQVDPYAGQVRGDLLKRAYQNSDGPRVAAFFKGFLKENAIVTPPPATAAPAAAPAAPQVTLESMVAPGAPKTGVPSAQDGSGKRVWTRGEIAKFYKDRTDGKFNSEEGKKRATALERDIFAAQNEGRVRG